MRSLTVNVATLCNSSGQTAVANRTINLYYHKNDLSGKYPAVVYAPGFMSLGRATKSNFMANHCAQRGYDYVCYDPEGVVDVSDAADTEVISNFEQLKFSHWFDDCHTAIQTVTKERKDHQGVILVGSSMGAWISLKMVLTHPSLVKGLLLIAPSLNFMWPKYQMWYKSFDIDTQQRLDAGETVVLPTVYGKMPISRAFAAQSREMELELPLDVQCPVRILHGINDDVVPFERGIQLAKGIKTGDVDIILRKSGTHRMSESADLDLLADTLDKLIVNELNCHLVR